MADTVMIAETRFAKSYSSIWRGLTPTLELFVRKANLRLFERDFAPLESTSPPGRRALINQVAFESVKWSASEAKGGRSHGELAKKISYLQDAEMRLIGTNLLTDNELNEASSLAERMHFNLFFAQRYPVELSPYFPGCGIINSCFGDGLTPAGRFIELKDGDRPFRSYEFRQLTIYAALHVNNGGALPTEFQIINSRRGVSITVSFSEFAKEVAGQSGYDLLTEVIRAISDISIST